MLHKFREIVFLVKLTCYRYSYTIVLSPCTHLRLHYTLMLTACPRYEHNDLLTVMYMYTLMLTACPRHECNVLLTVLYMYTLTYQSVSQEKQKTAAELEERERTAKQLEEEKKQLQEVTSHLKGDLSVRCTPLNIRENRSSYTPLHTMPLLGYLN